MIPSADPKANYLAHRAEIDAAIQRVLDSGRYILDEEVAAFEAEFARFVGVAHAVGVANGTDALQLALRAAGVGAGDEVITVSHTAVATVAAIEQSGAAPVLVDIDSQTFTLDPDCLASAITSKTKAIVPVHLYGHPASMSAIMEIAEEHQLVVVEDCAQAHGAAIRGRKVGTWGHAAAFSFYPTKNLGAFGDGGAVVTNNKTYAERVRELRQYGWREGHVSERPGINSRLDELQAAVLRVKLRHLELENQQRRTLAAAYDDGLRSTTLKLPSVAENCLHVYHQYVIRSGQRDKLRAMLEEQGVGTQIHYPTPIHQQPAYRRLRADCPVTEEIAGEILSLPMHGQLNGREVERVCEIIVAGVD
jgi:dTDP-4-amino-4,6-dideoxygalactose transaminase